jgi:hypothetical protein
MARAAIGETLLDRRAAVAAYYQQVNSPLGTAAK